MITKKDLLYKIRELWTEFGHHKCELLDLDRRVLKLEQRIANATQTESQLRAKQPTKIKVKGTPGRPKKVEVKVKKPASKQPRTKDGKFAKKK